MPETPDAEFGGIQDEDPAKRVSVGEGSVASERGEFGKEAEAKDLPKEDAVDVPKEAIKAVELDEKPIEPLERVSAMMSDSRCSDTADMPPSRWSQIPNDRVDDDGGLGDAGGSYKSDSPRIASDRLGSNSQEVEKLFTPAPISFREQQSTGCRRKLRIVCDFVYSCVEQVQIPKELIVRNWKIGLVNRFLQAAAFAFLLYLAFFDDSSLYITRPNEMGVTQMRVTANGGDGWQIESQADMEAPFCQGEDSFANQNFSCEALGEGERYWQEDSSFMFVPAFFVESTYSQTVALPSGLTSCDDMTSISSYQCSIPWEEVEDVNIGSTTCGCRSTRAGFAVGLKSYVISFDHAYQFYDQGRLGHHSSQASFSSCTDGGWECATDCKGLRMSSRVGITAGCEQRDRELLTTVYVRGPLSDKAGYMTSFYSPEHINLPLKRILELAGVDLDDEQSPQHWDELGGLEQILMVEVEQRRERGEQALPPPKLRQTGALLSIDLEYLNDKFHDRDDHVPASHAGPICKVVISVRPLLSKRARIDCTSGPCTTREFLGFRVVFSASGTFGFNDWLITAQFVGGAIVYMFVPTTLMLILSMYCMGAVSKIYYRAGTRPLRISDEIAGLVSRMCVSMAGFEALKDEHNNLSKEALLDCINQGFREHKDLDFEERVKLAELVYETVDEDESGQITMQEYVQACASNELATVQQAVAFFSTSRKTSCLERFFRPASQLKGTREIYPKLENGEYDRELLQKRCEKLGRHVRVKGENPNQQESETKPTEGEMEATEM